MAQVRLDSAAINRLLRSPQGDVAKDLIRRGQRVSNRAKQNLRGAGEPRLKAFDTGALTNSIAQEFLVVDGDPVVRVGANTYYALWIHEGTRRMRARPYLREALSAAR
jgi:hypothetical protein